MSANTTISIRDLQRKQHPSELQPGIQITKAGGILRGRYVGTKNFVFGSDVSQVLQRLERLNNTYRLGGCRPKDVDISADRAERAAERVAVKVQKRAYRYEPKGRI